MFQDPTGQVHSYDEVPKQVRQIIDYTSALPLHPKPDWRESFCVKGLWAESKTWTESGATGTEALLSVYFQ